MRHGPWPPARTRSSRAWGPGCNYLAHCQSLAQSENGNTSLVALSIVAALQGKIRHIKLEYPVADRDQAWFSMTATGMQDGSGVVVAHLDVTDRMAWERSVRRKEHLFKATTENALDLIAILAADGSTVYASPSYAMTLGYPLPTMVRGKLQDLVCATDQAAFREHCRTALNNGMSPLFEYGAQHHDGQLLHLEARGGGGGTTPVVSATRSCSSPGTSPPKRRPEMERARMEASCATPEDGGGRPIVGGHCPRDQHSCQFLSDNLKFLQEAFAGFVTVTAA